MFKLIKKEFHSINWNIKIILLFTLPAAFFLYFYDFGEQNFLWKLEDWTKWKQFWKSIGFFGIIFSILNVCLISQRKLSNFFYGFFSCVFYGLYAAYSGYNGDFLTNWFFYLPMIFVGYKKWKSGYNVKKIKIIKNKWSVKHTLNIILMSGILFILWFFLTPFISDLKILLFGFNKYEAKLFFGEYKNLDISNTWLFEWEKVFNNNLDTQRKLFIQNWEYGKLYTFWNGTTSIKALFHPLHFFDAFTSMGAMVSTYYLNARLPADNIYYLLMNPASITMWSVLGDYGYVLTYSLYMVFSILGVYDWFFKK